MSNNIRNPSGNIDLTSFIALNNIDKTEEISDAKRTYIKKKYSMLTCEFLFFPTEQELLSLYKCHTERQIDKAVIRIILDHWDKE